MCSLKADGRNDIPVNNSEAKCLLENWVEERATSHLDPHGIDPKYTSRAQVLRNGHKGILTTDLKAKGQCLTTTRESFQTPKFPGVRTRGKKEELFERMLYNKLVDETVIELNEPPPPPEYITTKQQDYDKPDFKTTYPPPTRDHKVNTDQCVTFWSTHYDKIHGVSQIKARDTPFKKDSAFSKPISEYFDQPKPYEDEEYPNQ